jgi:general secretion pathway protein G
VRAFEHRGTRCLGLTFPGLPVPIEPALALRRGHLFAAASPQALGAALDHARSGGAGLLGHPALRALEPGTLDDLQGLYFSDVPRLARDGYGLSGMLAAALANAVRSPADPLREPGLVLPPLGELLANARPSLFLSRLQGEDLVTVGRGDRSAALHLAAMLGWTPALLAGIGLTGTLATLVVPPAVEDLAVAQEMEVHADIWVLMDALHTYAIENDGRYPASLDELLVADENGYTFLDAEQVPPDPWGNPYQYELTDNQPHVFTYGADGVPGGAGPDRDIDNLALERGAEDEADAPAPED